MEPLPTPRTIAVYVGLDAVGDGLMKLPFVRALRAAYPQAHITWLAGKGKSVYSGSLAPLIEGLIDEVLDDAGIGTLPRELIGPRPLKDRHFDLFIDSQRRVLTTLIIKRIPHTWFISGTAGYLFCKPRPPKALRRKDKGLVGQLLWLLQMITGKPPEAGAPLALASGVRDAAAALLPDGPLYVGLAPGAGGKHKCWPLENFTALAKAQAAQGRKPVIFLGPAETEWVAPLAAEVPQALFPLQAEAAAAAGLSPQLTIALGERCQACVANDSGTGHMLAASGSPLVSLFGPTLHTRFAPMGARKMTVLTARDHGGEDMALIPLPAVIAAVEAMLGA